MIAELVNTNNEKLKVNYSADNVHVYDSYLIPAKKIKAWVRQIKEFGENNGYFYSRGVFEWANEWKAHNLLYAWNIKRSSTQEVDLNEDETAMRKIGYFLLSLLYR